MVDFYDTNVDDFTGQKRIISMIQTVYWTVWTELIDTIKIHYYYWSETTYTILYPTKQIDWDDAQYTHLTNWW